MTSIKRHNKLGYAEYRAVEDLIRKVWTPKGYEVGASDTTIAEAASVLLNALVNTTNVCFVREAMGMHEKLNALQAKLLNQQELTRLEDALATKKAHVVIQNKRLTIYTLDSYQALVDSTNRIKPWEQTSNGKRKAHAKVA